MTDYSKMSDAEINVEVAKIQFPRSERNTPYYHRPDVYIYHRNGTHEAKDFCNSWADAGPIIEENKISINAHGSNGWIAWKNTGKNLEEISSNRHQFSGISVRPLRAAMECFLMMKESENVS